MKTNFLALCCVVIVAGAVSGCRPANTPPTPEAGMATNTPAPIPPSAPISTNPAPQVPTTGEPTKP